MNYEIINAKDYLLHRMSHFLMCLQLLWLAEYKIGLPGGLSFHDDKKISLRYFIVELMVIVSRDV